MLLFRTFLFRSVWSGGHSSDRDNDLEDDEDDDEDEEEEEEEEEEDDEEDEEENEGDAASTSDDNCDLSSGDENVFRGRLKTLRSSKRKVIVRRLKWPNLLNSLLSAVLKLGTDATSNFERRGSNGNIKGLLGVTSIILSAVDLRGLGK